MKNELSPAVLSAIGSIVILVAVVGGLGYWFYDTISVEQPAVAATQYPVGVLSEFESSGVFVKTRSLQAPGGGQVTPATPIPVAAGDVGKSDLGSLE